MTITNTEGLSDELLLLAKSATGEISASMRFAPGETWPISEVIGCLTDWAETDPSRVITLSHRAANSAGGVEVKAPQQAMDYMQLKAAREALEVAKEALVAADDRDQKARFRANSPRMDAEVIHLRTTALRTIRALSLDSNKGDGNG